MSRTIKFRAWAKDWDHDKFEYVYADQKGDISDIGWGAPYAIINEKMVFAIFTDELFDGIDEFPVYKGGHICEAEAVEQYTGLKDKNGKEIYEGDIVKTTDRVTAKGLIFPVGVVEFKQQAFWICNVPSERPDFTHNETLLQYWETDLEVIGNIHENPELLEDKNGEN